MTKKQLIQLLGDYREINEALACSLDDARAEIASLIERAPDVEWSHSSAVVRLNQAHNALKAAGLPVPEYMERRGRDWPADPVRLALLPKVSR